MLFNIVTEALSALIKKATTREFFNGFHVGFELVVGLKLDLQKSKLLRVNVEDQQIDQWASLLCCKSERFPCQYFWLPLGAVKNLVHLWAPIVEKFKNKLAGWKAKMLSFGGKITLVKSLYRGLAAACEPKVTEDNVFRQNIHFAVAAGI
ncbi:hypothetical protein GQ457_04G017100 [Hibiscus cannabinus]